MKLKFLILISSLLLAPLISGEVMSAQPFECVAWEVEEESYVAVAAPIVDNVIIEDGGSFGSKALVPAYSETQQIVIPIRLSIGISSSFVNSSATPRYIAYCRLKVAC